MAKNKTKDLKEAKGKSTKSSTKPSEKLVPSSEFILTISDTEDGIPDIDEDDDFDDDDSDLIKARKQRELDSQSESEEEEEEVEEEQYPRKKAKKQTKKSNDVKREQREQDLDPDFEFSLNGFDNSEKFNGEWDFEGIIENEKDKARGKKGVDLDEILRRKGGLDKFEEDNEDENEEMDSDNDELALDGFGMGAADLEEGGDDQEDNDDDDDEDEGEDEVDEEVEDNVEDSDDEDKEKDTAEEVAKFYAPTEESENAKDTIHKTFQTLSLSRPIHRGLSALGYNEPSPVQSAVIPIALMGKDVVAGAVTGSGKTAAYLIPVLERLLYRPKNVASTRVVVLTPTRELAIQVCDVGRKIGQFTGGIRFGLAVGGLNLRVQEQELKTRPDVVIATPGRFIDHIRNSPSFQVDGVEILVVDEADRMLEEGFQKELTEILSLIPSKRQTLLFSATMNSSIKDLIQLSLHRPVRVLIDPPKQSAKGLVQEFIRIRKRDNLKPSLLAYLLKRMDSTQRVIVFVSRKESAHRLRIILGLLGMKIAELHGSLSQEQRLNAVTSFRNLDVPVLICTDLASRGLDIPKIEVVVNYDMPKTHEVYLHRVGRTARAGREGTSISFVGEATVDRSIVKAVMKAQANGNSKKNKIVGRNVDWTEIEKTNKIIEEKTDTIKEVLEEEKQEKLIAQAERDITKGENLIKYKDEIQSRPKRTWFESTKEKKENKESNKRKKNVDPEGGRVYKKTKSDRMDDQAQKFKKNNKDKNKNEKNNGNNKKLTHKTKRGKKGKK